MPERDGYIPGVPCWVDTSQPDPERALPFYEGLFGWEFEDVMPEGADGEYFIGRIRGGDVAAVRAIPDGGPADARRGTPTSGSTAPTRRRRRPATPAARAGEPFDVWTRDAWPSSAIPKVRCSASGRPRSTRARRS